jgi:phosphoribosylamine--glycine ligase
MKVLVLGGGGREHALAWRLARDRGIEVHAAPGNPGLAQLATCHPEVGPGDADAVERLALDIGARLVVVGPEEPLVRGVVDRLAASRIPAFGPSPLAAEIESSKAYAKGLMARRGIPTADSAIFESWPEAQRFILRRGGPLWVKADGLCAGKGAVAAPSTEDALTAAREMLVEGRYGDAGRRIVVEESLCGPEVSLICITDGRDLVTLAPAQDHKAAYDGDRGPNTGGMGAYSPVPFCPPALVEALERQVLRPAVEGLAEEGREYRGALYAGLMLTAAGPRVLEFNARFGDPEAQAILPRLRGPFAEILLAAACGQLGEVKAALGWDRRAAVCVVMASAGYPGRYQKGVPIGGLGEAEAEARAYSDGGAGQAPAGAAGQAEVIVFHAGTALEPGAGGRLVTAGGRVLGVTALAEPIEGAVELAYRAVSRVVFPGAHYRRDIGWQALGRVPREDPDGGPSGRSPAVRPGESDRRSPR